MPTLNEYQSNIRHVEFLLMKLALLGLKWDAYYNEHAAATRLCIKIKRINDKRIDKLVEQVWTRWALRLTENEILFMYTKALPPNWKAKPYAQYLADAIAFNNKVTA
jgi:hypothetical protein